MADFADVSISSVDVEVDIAHAPPSVSPTPSADDGIHGVFRVERLRYFIWDAERRYDSAEPGPDTDPEKIEALPATSGRVSTPSASVLWLIKAGRLRMKHTVGPVITDRVAIDVQMQRVANSGAGIGVCPSPPYLRKEGDYGLRRYLHGEGDVS